MARFKVPAAVLLGQMASIGLAWDVARTPPMGFNTWNLYHCSVDASILIETAQAMVKFGLRNAGYIYVNSDDCWMSAQRSANGSQVPDPQKFPKGFKEVTDAIHALNMKSGLYTAKGPLTCQKRAASCLHESQDALQWASWGIDYVKDDSCSTCSMANGTKYTDAEDYHRMWEAIQASGRPMVLTVEGSPPASLITHGGYGNAKRVGHDISPTWASMISLVDIGSGLWPYAHNSSDPKFGGWWNDLDMIEIGNGGPKGSPPPPPSPSPPNGMWPWAVPPATADVTWSINAAGEVKNNGLCLTAGSTLSLTACTAGNTNQQFVLEASTGNLFLQAKHSSCVALYDGFGPRLTMAACKTGPLGANEEWTLVNGQLCSHTLRNFVSALCLKAESSVPGGGGGGSESGFNCSYNPAALARCRVHFTMWTIMKAPLLLGNNIPEMDSVTIGVVTNKAAISISQDPLGVQAQRVWTAPGPTATVGKFSHSASVSVAARPCNQGSATQRWRINGTRLISTDTDGVEWCVVDIDGTEQVGSFRAVPCSMVGSNVAAFHWHRAVDGSVALITASGRHLSVNNAIGASGPVQHSRYLYAAEERSTMSMWHVIPHSGKEDEDAQLMFVDRYGLLNDDKIGGVTVGGDFCLDLAQDGDIEVWAGPLTGSRWAVALLNRDPTANATITAHFSAFNATSSTYKVHDVWEAQDLDPATGFVAANVAPQAVRYFILTPK